MCDVKGGLQLGALGRTWDGPRTCMCNPGRTAVVANQRDALWITSGREDEEAARVIWPLV